MCIAHLRHRLQQQRRAAGRPRVRGHPQGHLVQHALQVLEHLWVWSWCGRASNMFGFEKHCVREGPTDGTK